MRFSTLLSAIAATAVTASPIAASHDQETNLPSCHYSSAPTNKEWRIVVQNDQKYNTNCGRGVLDNARGACGNIEAWECYYTDAQKGEAIITFRSPKGCKASSIAGAVSAAFQGDLPQGFTCVDTLHDQGRPHGARPYDPFVADSGRHWPPHEASVHAGARLGRGRTLKLGEQH